MPVVISLVMPWLIMSMAVVPVTVIANGMGMPVRMVSFPSVKAIQSPGFTTQPDIARPQIEIDTAHKADVFVTVPDVIVRNPCVNRNHGRRCRSRDHQGPEINPSIRLNDAAGYQNQCQGRDA